MLLFGGGQCRASAWRCWRPLDGRRVGTPIIYWSCNIHIFMSFSVAPEGCQKLWCVWHVVAHTTPHMTELTASHARVVSLMPCAACLVLWLRLIWSVTCFLLSFELTPAVIIPHDFYTHLAGGSTYLLHCVRFVYLAAVIAMHNFAFTLALSLRHGMPIIKSNT